MKKSLLIVVLILFVVSSNAQNIWTNEFHYDNVGTDEGEFIEIVLENAGSYNLADFAVTLYNGNSGASYDTKTFDQFTIGIVEGDFTIYYFDYPSNGIQNGESDGIAISYQGVLIPGQFLSYEGTLTAADGPAAGVTSTDIGVSEIGADVGTSLQLSGEGSQYNEFIWEESAPETKGALNNNQSFGAYVPDPEPTNYPAGFTAEAEGVSIVLDWTDAIGEQLPSGYLILGELSTDRNEAFTPPVDGVPVDDDFSWLNGEIAANIAFGVETFTIEVDPNTDYTFIIYSYTNSGVNIDYKTDGTPPEVSILSNNFTVINKEVFALGLGSWTPYNVIGDQVWEHDTGDGVPPGCALMNGYDGGSQENEDWLISPLMDLTGYLSTEFEFLSATYYTGPALQLFFSQDYDGSSDPNGFTWLELTNNASWSTGNWEWTESGSVDLSLYEYSTCYLAFKYISTSTESAAWKVDNLLVYGTLPVGLIEKKNDNLWLFPNPATEHVSLVFEQEGQVSIVNISGQTVLMQDVTKGMNTIQISNLTKGIYMIHFMGTDHTIQTGKLLVE